MGLKATTNRLANPIFTGTINADDSAASFGGNVQADGTVWASKGSAIPAGGTAGVGLVFASGGSMGVFFGSGAPTLSAAKGSLYLRSDGSGVSDRAYINTDGSTTWTALTTAA